MKEQDKLVKELRKRFAENMMIEIVEIPKNNGVIKTGVRIGHINGKDFPIIFIDDWLNGDMPLNEICDNVYQCYCDFMQNEICIVKNLDCFNEVKNLIRCKLINAEKNKNLINKLPNRQFKDLLIIPYVEWDVYGIGRASTVVTNDILNTWNVNSEMVIQVGLDNVQNEFIIYPINSLVKKLCGIPVEEIDIEMIDEVYNEIYVISKKGLNLGAIAMLNQDLLEEFADRINNDFYILPSSIHEVMFCTTHLSANAYLSMVREINATQVSDDEILSDNIYFYNRKEKTLTMIS